jgi:tetratricopeptide (TPR) repeat protein
VLAGEFMLKMLGTFILLVLSLHALSSSSWLVSGIIGDADGIIAPRIEIADALIEAGNYVAAKDKFLLLARGMRLNVKNRYSEEYFWAWYRYAICCLHISDWEESYEGFSYASRARPNRMEPLWMVGRHFLYDVPDYELAYGFLQTASELEYRPEFLYSDQSEWEFSLLDDLAVAAFHVASEETLQQAISLCSQLLYGVPSRKFPHLLRTHRTRITANMEDAQKALDTLLALQNGEITKEMYLASRPASRLAPPDPDQANGPTLLQLEDRISTARASMDEATGKNGKAKSLREQLAAHKLMQQEAAPGTSTYALIAVVFVIVAAVFYKVASSREIGMHDTNTKEK